MALLVMDELLQLSEMERFEDWLAHLKILTRKLGYSNFLIGLKPAPTDANQQVLIYSDYPDAWRTRYDAESYAAVDPVVQHCLNANRPLLWDRENYCRPSESEFFEEAAAHGLEQGLALPLHGPRGEAGMLCLKPDESGAQAAVSIAELCCGCSCTCSAPPASALRRARRYWRRLFGCSQSNPAATVTGVGSTSVMPWARSRNGRTTTSAVISAADGLPGMPIHGLPPTSPKARGLPG